MIKVDEITKHYGKKPVLDGVSLELKKCEIVGIMGPNGAGKTTLLKIISGLLKSDSGTVTRDSDSICAIIENPAFSLDMTGLANIEYYLDRKLTDEEIQNAPFGCAEFVRTLVYKYSMGMKQKLALWLVMLKNAEYILLDEPSNHLDAKSIKEMKRHILEAGKKSGILIVSHDFSEIRDICDRVLIISDRKLIEEIKIQDKDDLIAKDTAYFIRTLQPVEDELRDKFKADLVEEGILVHGNESDIADMVKELVLNGYGICEVTVKRTGLEETYNRVVYQKN